jgi:hypothetical protein
VTVGAAPPATRTLTCDVVTPLAEAVFVTIVPLGTVGRTRTCTVILPGLLLLTFNGQVTFWPEVEHALVLPFAVTLISSRLLSMLSCSATGILEALSVTTERL